MQTHNVALASSLAEYVVSLGSDGRIEAQGTIFDVLEKESELLQALKNNDDDEEDGGLFTNIQSHSLFPPSSSPMPLRTPIKPSGSVLSPEQPVLSVNNLNSTQTAGTKRKPTPAVTTAFRKLTLTR